MKKYNYINKTFSQKGKSANLESVHERKKLQKSENVFLDHDSVDICLKRDLKKHGFKHLALVHKGKKPFQCNTCDASFAKNDHLKRHIASAHEGKNP